MKIEKLVDAIDSFNRQYLLGASLGSMLGCLIGLAFAPYGFLWVVFAAGTIAMALVAQGTWNQYHKKEKQDD